VPEIPARPVIAAAMTKATTPIEVTVLVRPGMVAVVLG